MEYAVNTRPLLQSESESDFDDDVTDDVGSAHSVDEPIIVIKDSKPLFKTREPQDKFYVAYIIFYFLGMTTLLPWNFFITADDYWMYKFRYVNETAPHSMPAQPGIRTPLQKSFTAYLSVASTVPSTLFLILNSAVAHKISIHRRMLGSFGFILVFFIITTAFVRINTDAWQYEFFYLTMTIVVLLNITSAILTGGLFGMLGKFSAAYISAASSGQALGGIFAALAEILSLWLGASAQLSAFVYFMVADVFLIISVVCYIVLIRAVFFKFHMVERPQLSVQFEPGCASSEDIDVPTVSYRRVLNKIWVHGCAVWMAFFVSLSLYPAVTVLIESENKGHGHVWNDIYFVPVIAYLTFSTFDYIGRVLAGSVLWPRQNARALFLTAVLRVVFIPLLLLCNAQPRQHLPVVVNDDAYYILLIVLFGFSNGYVVNLTMICAPKVCEPHEQEMAASIMAAFLGVGLACGSLLSMAIVSVL